MNDNNFNLTQQNGFNTHIKSLKESLHLEFIRYVDLFCIFWLILNKRLKIHNINSYNYLINKLNVLLNNENKDSIFKNNFNYLKYISNSTWSDIIDRFTFNINNKFNIKQRKCKHLQVLSQNDFESCTIALGREPFGLYSVLRSCVCKFKSNELKTKDIKTELKIKNINTELENICEELVQDKTYMCSKCIETNEKFPLVGMVTPFVLMKNGDDLIFNENKNTKNYFKKQKIEKRQKINGDYNSNNTNKQENNNENKDMNINFKLNQELYSEHRYPLQSYLENHIDDMKGQEYNNFDVDKKEKENNNDKTNNNNNTNNKENKKDEYNEEDNMNIKDSYWLSDNIFELVCLFLDEPGDEYCVREEIKILIKIMKDNIRQNISYDIKKNINYDIKNEDYLFDSNVLKKLVEDNEDLIKKITKLKPFPTLYWLIDKDLITKVSKLEGKGLIKQIEELVDNKIKEQKNKNNKEKDENNNNKINNKENKEDEENKNKEKQRDEEEKEDNIIKEIIKDNLYYMLRRYGITHPVLIQLMYNMIFNSNVFIKSKEEEGYKEEYLYFKSEGYNNNNKKEKENKKNKECNEIYKVLSILNTLRTQGISGNKDFIHIKCLHTHLAYEIAEGSLIGSIVSKLI